MDPTRPHDNDKTKKNTDTGTHTVRGGGERRGWHRKNMKLVESGLKLRSGGREGRRSEQLETATKWAVGVGDEVNKVK